MATFRSFRAISSVTLIGSLALTSAPSAVADEVRDNQWPLTTLKVGKTGNITKGKGQIVAVIDNGVASDHVDLKGNVLPGKNVVDGTSDTTPAPNEHHGTSMASIIAGHGHGKGNASGVIGLAPEAKILPVEDDGATERGFADSIRYAADQGASVINISLGGEKPKAPAEEQAIAYALSKNIPVVSATGNRGGKVTYPAAQNGVVAVGAVTKNNEIWDKSNYGPETLLTAPGVDIVSAGTKSDSAYSIANGTSDSAAYVSATLALLRAEFPDLTAGQLVNRLTRTAKLPSSLEGQKIPDEKYGYGAIQPLAALTEDIPKGSKLGPLSAPKFDNKGNTITGDEPSQAEIDAENAESEREAKIIWAVLGVMGVVFVGLVVLVVVLVRKKKKRQNSGPGGPSWPGGPGGPGMPGAYGPVQPQRGMPPVPPQQPGGDPAPPYQPPRS